MRRTTWFAASAAVLLFPAVGWCQQADQKQDTTQGQAAASSASSQPQTPATPPQDSLAAAARKAREQKKDAPKPARVFDNDNIPTHGGVSSVGSESSPTAGGNTANTQGKGGVASAGNGEKAWRDKFASLRHKLEQDEAELDVMQRELAVLDLQDYSDPTKAMQQGFTRSDINDKTSAIEAKKKQVEADKQAITDAEDDLRKAGGEPGWAR
jgi:hypothetical protein